MAYGLFAGMTETSILNNGWQVVAGVLGHDDGWRVVEKAREVKNAAEVEEWINKDPSLRKRQWYENSEAR